MVWVNSMWLISLVLSLTSALIATLLQQWARRYVEMPHRPAEPDNRARVRSFLFHGTEFYRMRLAVQIAPTLLHFSVFLFFAGLVVAFRTIDKSVAIAVDAAVGVFALAYVVLSILPCLDVACPYRTPMSYILWHPLHLILFTAALFLRWFVELLHRCLVKPGLGRVETSRQRILVGWSKSRQNSVKTHWGYITEGLGKSIINRGKTAANGDRKIVTRLFSLLTPGDTSKLRNFAASIPRDRVFELIPLIESGTIVLRDSLLTLLRSSATGTRVDESVEDARVRKRSLVVCLDAIHFIAKSFNVPDLNFFRANFANIGLMRPLWEDSDDDIRFTSRSICALLAKQVVSGALGENFREAQLRWLHDVTGVAPRAIHGTNMDQMNLKSFVYGVLSNQVGDIPTESFKETLAILLEVERTDPYFDTNFRNRLTEAVGWMQQQDRQDGRRIVDKLRSMFSLDSGTSSYPPARPLALTGSFRSLPGHTTSPEPHDGILFEEPRSHSAVSLSNPGEPFPSPQSTHSHTSNVPLGGNVPSPSTLPPLSLPVPYHYGVHDVDSRSHSDATPPDVVVPLP
jgi:hypothetical protein